MRSRSVTSRMAPMRTGRAPSPPLLRETPSDRKARAVLARMPVTMYSPWKPPAMCARTPGTSSGATHMRKMSPVRSSWRSYPCISHRRSLTSMTLPSAWMTSPSRATPTSAARSAHAGATALVADLDEQRRDVARSRVALPRPPAPGRLRRERGHSCGAPTATAHGNSRPPRGPIDRPIARRQLPVQNSPWTPSVSKISRKLA